MKIDTYKTFNQSAIQHLFKKTFSDSEGAAEGNLVGDLALELITKTPQQDLLGFVATDNEDLIGCILFSRLVYDAPVEAFLLSPVAVHTDHQRKGVGQKLINFGLDELREIGVDLVFTYGDPNYYKKVGFRPITEEEAMAPFALSQPEGWLGQTLSGVDIDSVSGRPRCVEAFDKPEYW